MQSRQEGGNVRDHCPLQQGLRLMVNVSHPPLIPSTRPLSTTTRIKTQLLHPLQPDEWRVRDHLPLQQGLRLVVSIL